MKKLKLILFLSTIATFHVFGQKPLSPAYEIRSDTATKMIVLPDSCWQMMADPLENLTLQEVLQSGEFQNTDKKLDYHFKTYWLRYQLANGMPTDVQVSFWFTDIPQSHLYLKKERADWQHYINGKFVPYNKRDGSKSLKEITLTIPAGESVLIYQKNTYNYILDRPVVASAGFSFQSVVIQNQTALYNSSVKVTFFLGLILLTIAINLYFFFIVREKEFLFFALFIFFYGIVIGAVLDNVFFKNNPVVLGYSIYIGIPFMLVSLIYAVRYFLKTFVSFPKWDKWLVFLSLVEIIGIWPLRIIPAVIHNSSVNSFVILSSLGLLILIYASLIIVALLSRRSKATDARLVIFGIVPISTLFICGVVFNLFANANYFNITNQTFVRLFKDFHQMINILYSVSVVWMMILFAYVLLLRFSILRKKYVQEKLDRETERSALIERQKVELEQQVAARTSELRQSLENLKSTQSQLIQSEKMASLGELTAGIAHEIQNPLNFVNNFSDINIELIEEANQEIDEGNVAEAKTILNDVKDNEQKIKHHGKRADAIVKSMLQHSRTSSGKKEPTDINALAEEYLRLSYHGMRAKDKSFNCEMKTDFDESLQKINIVPQGIGRVLLNLFNNAFYACGERSRTATLEDFQNLPKLQSYIPTVTIVTKKGKDHITITVTDNGNGIPSNIKDKIFQPFFTTKPTGSGTGLGLSLSYDVITKEHGGKIEVESTEGEGTEFTVSLPA